MPDRDFMTAGVSNLNTRRQFGLVRSLLKSLVPRAQCFCFYGLDRNCDWSSDGVDDHELDSYISELPDDVLRCQMEDSDWIRKNLPSGRTALVIPVSAGDKDGRGVLLAVFSRNAGKSSWFNPKLLADILQPAVRLVGETLRLGDEIASREAGRELAEKELKLVYKVDEKIHGTSRSHSGLAELVGQSGRFLKIGYSVLLIPGKRIRISATHSSWKDVNRKAVDKYLLETLMGKLEDQRGPSIFAIPPVKDADGPLKRGYQAMVCPLFDKSGNVEGMVAQLDRLVVEPFTEMHSRFMAHIVRKIEYVIEQSFDPMSGLMNRAGFEAQLHESIKSLDGDNQSHRIIYFDLDNLQLVNDTFGREAGDEVIVRFARLIDDHLPANAVATRLTADDFVILLAHSSLEDAIELTESIRSKNGELRYLKGDKSLNTTISAGISELGADTTQGAALTGARIACDAAQDHGADRIEIHDEANRSILKRYDDMHLIAEIQKSLDEDTFQLFAQPIVPLKDNADRTRYEILLRMLDSKGERISSKAFFSAAERYKLMPQIDRWVISRTMARLAEEKSILEATEARFAINLSGQTLSDEDILQFVEEEISGSGVPAHAICFEITESAAVSSREKAMEFIDALRELGCRFSLDDFGAGLSSFAYLKSFKVDVLKIDGGFIRDITENRISESMVAAITEVARVMELETVAEFVETSEAQKLVTSLGVDFAQGHAVGRPVHLDDILAALAKEKVG